MEESLPPKRRCISKNEEKTVGEQEFQLPNMIKQSVNNIIIDTKNESCRLNISNSPNSALEIPEIPKMSIEHKIPCKLRILTPDGRDLGEFNLEWRTDNLSKKHKIVISKLHNLKSAGKKVTVSSPTIGRISSSALKQTIMKRAKYNLINKTLCNSIPETNKVQILQQQEQQQQQNQYILPICKMHQAIETNEQICNNNINEVSISENPRNQNSSKYQIVDNVDQNLVYNVMKNTENDLKIQETRNENNFSGMNVSLSGNKDNKSLFPTLNCQNFIKSNNSDFLKMCTIYSKGKCIATIKNTENGKIITSLTAINFAQNCKQTDKNHEANCLDDNKNIHYEKVTEISDNRNKMLLDKSNVVLKNNKVHDMKLQKNVMTVIPNNKNCLPEPNIALTRKCDITIPFINDKNINNIEHNEISCSIIYDDIQSEHALKKTCENDDTYLRDTLCNQVNTQYTPDLQTTADIGTNIQLNIQNNKDFHPNDLVSQFNIINKAVDSVKDNELHKHAIQALADCGIGIERYVPIERPKAYKTVHDTQVQTMVFGLLDPTFFVSVDKDSSKKNILRMNHKTLHQIYNNDNNLVKLSNNMQYNNSASNVIEQENDFDIDNFINQICEENSILKVKDTLLTTNRCMKIVEKLEKDFEDAKRYDQNGRLGIHNAVLSNNIYLVQKQLIVLKLCKENIDILTQNGEVDFSIYLIYLFNQDNLINLMKILCRIFESWIKLN
jgi:hypothetical protein